MNAATAGIQTYADDNARRRSIAFLNWAHALDHFVLLIYPTVVIGLEVVYRRPYAELIALSTAAFVAFGVFSLPAGWLADHWSRHRTMAIFFFGIGASLFLTGFAREPWHIAAGLTLVGAFAAIYHPVGIAMLVASPENMGRLLGWNGLWGNLGLASAALLTGALVDTFGWRAAFYVPGMVCVAAGVLFLVLVNDPGKVKKTSKSLGLHVDARMMTRIFSIMLIATACGGIIFNSTTISMPKVFDERLAALTHTNFGIGLLVAVVYAMAAFAQVLMGTLIDRTELRRLMIGVALVQVPLMFLAANLQGWAMLGVALLMMLAVFGQIPLNDAIVGKYCADEYRARVLSVRYVVSLGVAALAVPMIAALHATEGGFGNVFMVLGVLAAGMLCASLFFPSRGELVAQMEKFGARAPA